MTCIAAMVKDGHVWMAGDLMGSNGFTKKVYPDSKVFTNGEFLIGYTSSFRMGQLLQYNWEQPPRLEGMSDREYIQLDVIESMRNCFNTFGYGIKDGLEHSGGNFLLGYRGCIYEMQDNFSILKHDDYAAVGSGQYHAEASLYLLANNPYISPAEALQTAIETAAQFTTSVSGECTIVTTDEVAAEQLNSIEESTPLTEDDFDKMSKDELKKYVFGSEETIEDVLLNLSQDVPPREVLETWNKDDLIKFILGEDIPDETNPVLKQWVSEDGVYNLTLFKDGTLNDGCGEEGFSKFVEVYEEMGGEDLKAYATMLEVKYSHNISYSKLAQRLDEKIQEIVDSMNN